MRELSHKHTLLKSFLSLLTLGITLFACIAFYFTEKWLFRAVEEEYKVKAAAIHQEVTNWFEHGQNIINLIAQSSQAEPVELHADLSATLKNLNDIHHFEYLAIASTDGEYSSFSWHAPKDYDPRQYPWYQDTLKQQQVTFSGYLCEAKGGQDLVAISAPLRLNGKLTGIVSGSASRAFLHSKFKDNLGVSGVEVIVFNQYRRVLMHNQDKYVGELLFQDPRLESEAQTVSYALRKDTGKIYHREAASYAIFPVLDGKLGIAVIFQQSQFQQRVLSESAIVLAKFAIILIFILVLFYFSHRKIVYPILRKLETDKDTLLPNKQKFMSLLRDECRSPDNAGIVFIVDILHYEVISTTYEATVVNQLRKMITERIRDITGNKAALGSFSDRRFVGFTTRRIDATSLEHSCIPKIMAQLKKPFYIDEMEVNLSFRSGIALYPQHGDSAEILMSNAQTALHMAYMDKYGSSCLFDWSLSTQISNDFSLMNALNNGLRRDELYLVYQPQYQVDCGQMVSMEALVRWDSSDLKRPVSPGELIPFVEDSELVVPFGDYIIEHVFQQVKVWQQDYQTPTVAINISAKHFLEPSFKINLLHALERHDIAPQQIELELTESCVMEQQDYAIGLLHELKNLGFKIALDDFGTGYSSLQYLKELPISKLKLDRSFVKDIEHSEEDKIIVESLVKLCQSLNITLLAEGVETQSQLAILSGLGVNMVQGYFYAKPMKVDSIHSYLSPTQQAYQI